MNEIPLTNGGFEEGNTSGWTISGSLFNATINNDPEWVFEGAYSLRIRGNLSGHIVGYVTSGVYPVGVDRLEVSARFYGPVDNKGRQPWNSRWRVEWYNDFNQLVTAQETDWVRSNETWQKISAAFFRPDGATRARISVIIAASGVGMQRDSYLDAISWNNTATLSAFLTNPANGSSYKPGQTIPLGISYSVYGTEISEVRYKFGSSVVRTATSHPYSATYSTDDSGTYSVTADILLANGSTLTVGPHSITILEPDTEDREYKASNSCSPLILSNFSGITSAMPSTSRITGVVVDLVYKLAVLSRVKDLNVNDPSQATAFTAFDVIGGGVIEPILYSRDNDTYTYLASGEPRSVPIDRSEFSLVETGTTGGKKWVVYEQEEFRTISVGRDTETFGQSSLPASSFTNNAIGLKFRAEVAPKPDYADSGDATYRIMIDKIRVRVYFDSGSAVYYFASPDKTQILKGTLVSSYVMSGDFRTGDASGVMQLLPDLEVMDGSQTWIGPDWTIHSAYPPTNDNQIGDVTDREYQDSIGMAYNKMPTQSDIIANRSRYLFITTNFYGDKDWDSMYGVNGVDRAFAYNGDYFYNIYTHPELEKDRPRHVANHHLHLALGYDQGRVDISVAGQPYNFNGAEGASTWAIGDQVVGLLPLSGMILGIFGNKSVHGLAGTTVDNFTTQVISPKRGAIEYTIADMGYPVYANSYGIYTLAQIQQYGDYAGTPMSDPVSPWFKDRLLRKNTSSKEVVCAWPVRTSNQYRLAFRDGYVVSMTMDDTKGYPTFSFLKYFITPPDESPNLGVALTDYPTIYPIAVSSELDDTGEERIHIANIDYVKPPPPPPPLSLEIGVAQMHGGS